MDLRLKEKVALVLGGHFKVGAGPFLLRYIPKARCLPREKESTEPASEFEWSPASPALVFCEAASRHEASKNSAI